MRIAVLILALCLTLFVGLQSCALTIAGGVAGQDEVVEAAGIGMSVAVLFAAGAAFVTAFPILSAAIFGFAAVLAFSFTGEFDDLSTWGTVAVGLAVMSFSGHHELKKKPGGDEP